MKIICPSCLCQRTFYALERIVGRCSFIVLVYYMSLQLGELVYFGDENICNTTATNQFSIEQCTRILFRMLLPLLSNI